MRLHVLAGCRELLQPNILEPEVAARLIGSKVRCATAFWLSEKCGTRYHYFLQDMPGDRRTQIMAKALRDEFGNRFEPLLILPDLLHEVESKSPTTTLNAVSVRSQLTVLSEIQAFGNVGQIRLYGLALPAEMSSSNTATSAGSVITNRVRDRLEHVRTELAVQAGIDDIDTEVIEVTAASPAFENIFHNAICNQVALRLASRLEQQNWVANAETLAKPISRILADWQKKGVAPILMVQEKQLDAITEIIHRKWF